MDGEWCWRVVGGLEEGCRPCKVEWSSGVDRHFSAGEEGVGCWLVDGGACWRVWEGGAALLAVVLRWKK